MNRVIITIIFFFLATAGCLFKQGMALSESELKNYLEPSVVYDAEGQKDPFLPPKIEEKKVVLPEETPEPKIPDIVNPPSLTIQGIVWGGILPQAIVNEAIVEIGDTVEGASIIDIKKDGITISFKDQQFSFPAPALNKDLPVSKKTQNPGQQVTVPASVAMLVPKPEAIKNLPYVKSDGYYGQKKDGEAMVLRDQEPIIPAPRLSKKSNRR